MKKNPTLIYGDTETSGLEVEDKIVQLAFSYIEKPKTNYGQFHRKPTRHYFETLSNPGLSINPESASITSIFDVDVKHEKNLTNTFEYKKLTDILKQENTFFVAYNAPFDVDMIEKDGLFIPADQVLDLYRVMKHLYKNEKVRNRNGEWVPLANNKMQYFRALLRFDEHAEFHKLVKEYGIDRIQAHTALSDVIVLEYLYQYIVKTFGLSFEEMLELSNTPVLEPFITFGNVFDKGTPFHECLTSTYVQYNRQKNGYDYIDWCSNNLTLSVDTEWSIKLHFYNALINGDIPYSKKYIEYINYGIVFETNSSKIDNALQLIEKDYDYFEDTKKRFIEKLETDVENRVDKNLGDRFPSLFLLRYLNKIEVDRKVHVSTENIVHQEDRDAIE